MASRTTVKLNRAICDRARTAAKSAGYSSLEEFIEHALEKELANHPDSELSVSNEELKRKLKGLGYIG